MNHDEKSFTKKLLEFISMSIKGTPVELAKYVAVDGTEIEVAEDGTTSAADGEYTLEDGSILTVAEGKATLADPKTEDEVLADNGTETVADERDNKIAEQEKTIAELEAKIKELEGEKENLSTEKQTLSKQVEDLSKEPATESVNLSTEKQSRKLSKAEIALQAYFAKQNIK